MTLFTVTLFVVPVWLLLDYLRGANGIVYIVVGAVLLKTTFSIKGLRRAALKIKNLLEADDLEVSRRELRALVSRDTAGLPRPLLASAAVESVAEGAGDSIVAPLFWFLLLGVPGAVGYRAVNTLDAMIGYRGRYEHLGKFAARLDDVLNFIPARLAALLLVLAAALKKASGPAWRTARREHTLTASPNAGWPMAAMAGALGVRLEKPGYYVLGDGGAPPGTEIIGRAVGLLSTAAAAWVLLCFIAGGIRIAVTT
jgi:adenosylcobinamide-phosphate synthase